MPKNQWGPSDVDAVDIEGATVVVSVAAVSANRAVVDMGAVAAATSKDAAKAGAVGTARG